MKLITVIPNVFYEELDVGIAFFCDGMGYRDVHRAEDGELCIVRRDATVFHLCRNVELARVDRPEFRVSTDDIDAYHGEILARAPHILHPNGRVVADKPWGLREFAMLDPTGVCIIVEQPVAARTPDA